MFKVGDKVIVVDAQSVGDYYKNGDIGVVSEIDSNCHGYVTREDGVRMNVYWSEVKLYEEPVSKINQVFKVGDRVKFKRGSINTGMSDATESDVFEVSKVGPAHIQLRDVIYSLTGWWNVTHFEHVKEEIMSHADGDTENYVPEVGDKVKGFAFESGTDDIYYAKSMDAYVGELGEVVRVGVDRYAVQFDSTDYSWTYPISLAHLAKMDSDESGDTAVPEDNTAIDWEIGQEVFCLIFGKGKVDYIGKDKDISVAFEKDAGIRWYTSDGKYFEDANRTLFFSEPKIEAEKFPPKKPFVPVFKKGDAVIVKWVDTTQVLILEEETERQVKGTCGQVWDKDPDVHFYKIGEEVKFS